MDKQGVIKVKDLKNNTHTQKKDKKQIRDRTKLQGKRNSRHLS